MDLLRASTIALSVALHGAVAASLVKFDSGLSLEAGSGNDLLRIEQGLAIEGLSRVGEAPETIEARDPETVQKSVAAPALDEVKAVEPPPQTPPQEVALLEPPPKPETPPEPKLQPKPPEERLPAPPEAIQTEKPLEIEDVIASPLGEQREVLTAPIAPPPQEIKPEPIKEVKPQRPPDVHPPEFEKPPEIKPEPIEQVKAPTPPDLRAPQPKQVPTELQVEQVAVVEQQAASKGQEGGDATVYRAYLGSISKHVEKSKVKPSRLLRGTVVVRFTLDRKGTVLQREVAQSSGSRELDEAAIKTIDSASPFPPIPENVPREEIVLTQQFRFVVR